MQAQQLSRNCTRASTGPTRVKPFGTSRPARASTCSTQQHVEHSLHVEQQLRADRRDILLQLGSFTAAAVLSNLAGPQSATAAAGQGQVPEVGTYLPSAGIDDLVLFQPDARKTPALRAGTVDPNSPYKFALPPSFRWECCGQ